MDNLKLCIWCGEGFHPLENPLYSQSAAIVNTTGGAESTTRGINPVVANVAPTAELSILVNRLSSRGSMSNPQPKSKANSDEVSCYVCKQSRPCCRQPLLELRERGTHEKFVWPIPGLLKEAWGLGSVWVT